MQIYVAAFVHEAWTTREPVFTRGLSDDMKNNQTSAYLWLPSSLDFLLLNLS